MKVSEIKDKINVDIKCIVDGEFDAVCLIGLRCDKSQKHIAYVLNSDYINDAINEGVDCIIGTPEIIAELREVFKGGICETEDPKAAMFQLHNYMAKDQEKAQSVIDNSVIIGEGSIISEKNVVIEENVMIGRNVIIKDNVIIGKDTVIMDNTIIGTPAFYYFGSQSERTMVKSTGGVEIGQNVNIHCNVIICKGVIGGNTVIGDNTAIDNGVFLGHDVNIGSNCIVTARSSFGGWVRIGENSFVGVNTSVAPAVEVGQNTKLSIGAVVTRDVPSGTQVSGNFAIDHDAFISDLKSKRM